MPNRKLSKNVNLEKIHTVVQQINFNKLNKILTAY